MLASQLQILLTICSTRPGIDSLVNLEEEDEQDETDDVASIEDLQDGYPS